MTSPPEPLEARKAHHGFGRPRRRLTLADGLILIAAAAAGFAIARIPQGVYPGSAVVVNGDEVSMFAKVLLSTYWASLMIMIALIPLRLMRPRPPFRWIRRQPGFIACLTVAFGIAHMGLYFAVQRFKQPNPWNIDILLLIVSPSMGSLIISAWLVLAVSGGWRPEASWIDRAGRLLAITWILRYLIHVFVERWG